MTAAVHDITAGAELFINRDIPLAAEMATQHATLEMTAVAQRIISLVGQTAPHPKTNQGTRHKQNGQSQKQMRHEK